MEQTVVTTLQSLLVFMFLMTGALINFYLIAKWYVWPRLNALATREAVQPLLQLVGFRYLGAVCLTPNQVSGDLPPGWGQATAIGDSLVALLALISLMALRQNWSAATTLVWITGIFGIVDLAYAFITAMVGDVPQTAGGLIYGISTIYAPAGLVALIMIIMLLRRKE